MTLTIGIGPAVGPPTQDREALQARRWLNNEARKPEIRVSRTVAAEFNYWTGHRDEFVVRMQILRPNKTVLQPAAADMAQRFFKEKAEALKAQGVKEGAKDWWKEVLSRKARDDARDNENWLRMLEDSPRTNPDDWRRAKVGVKEDEDEEEGGNELYMEDTEEGKWGDDEGSGMELGSVTGAVTEAPDDEML